MLLVRSASRASPDARSTIITSSDELFIILEGEGTYRFGDESYPVKAGDVLGAPAGGSETAHQIINTGTVPLRYFAHLDDGRDARSSSIRTAASSASSRATTRQPALRDKADRPRMLQHLEHAGVDYLGPANRAPGKQTTDDHPHA